MLISFQTVFWLKKITRIIVHIKLLIIQSYMVYVSRSIKQLTI